MISTEQIDEWLRDHCRVSGTSWVWPRGTVYSQEQSREIVRVHLALGMEPTEMITVKMISYMLRRIESLERMFSALGAPGAVTPLLPDPNHWSSWTAPDGAPQGSGCAPMRDIVREGDPRMNLLQDLIEGDGRRMDRAATLLDATNRMSPEDRSEYLATVCPQCIHVKHPGVRCTQDAPSAQGRTCRCPVGLTTATANADVIREGMARLRIGAADDFEDVKAYLEGGPEESEAAARRLDQHSVDTGQLSPAAYRAVWNEPPERTEQGHRHWCARRDHGAAECPWWETV